MLSNDIGDGLSDKKYTEHILQREKVKKSSVISGYSCSWEQKTNTISSELHTGHRTIFSLIISVMLR